MTKRTERHLNAILGFIAGLNIGMMIKNLIIGNYDLVPLGIVGAVPALLVILLW